MRLMAGYSKLQSCNLLFAAGLVLSAIAYADSGQERDGNVVAKWQYQALSQKPEDQGLGTLDLHLEDAVSHQPISYRPEQLAVWLQPNRHALSDEELACDIKLRMLATQGLGQRAEIDLNGWRLLTLNHDRTLAFINPFIGINQAKLESIITLPGDVDAWLSQPGRLQLWLHAVNGNKARVLSVDTHRRKIMRSIDVPRSSGKLALDGNGKQLWLLAKDAGQIAVLDSHHDTPVHLLPAVGIGELAKAPDNGVFAWNSSEPELMLWQNQPIGKPQISKTWTFPAPVKTLVWSELAQRLLVALADGSIAWLNIHHPSQAIERIQHVGSSGSHVDRLALFDDGRRLLWLDRGSRQAGVVDVASGRLLVQTDVIANIDNIAFSVDFAYLHSSIDGKATLLSLSNLRSGRANPVEVTTGQPAPQKLVGQLLATDPSGHGMLIANPRDGVVYQYAEGMMQPMGSYSNYRRSALAISVLNTGLSKIEPGHFRAPVRHERGGKHELIWGGSDPGFAVCAQLQLPETKKEQEPAANPVIVKLEELGPANPAADLARTVRLSLMRESSSGDNMPVSGIDDLTMLVFNPHTAWQKRFHLKESSPGFYTSTIHVPRSGRYDLQVRSLNHALSYQDGLLGSHEVIAP